MDKLIKRLSTFTPPPHPTHTKIKCLRMGKCSDVGHGFKGKNITNTLAFLYQSIDFKIKDILDQNLNYIQICIG